MDEKFALIEVVEDEARDQLPETGANTDVDDDAEEQRPAGRRRHLLAFALALLVLLSSIGGAVSWYATGPLHDSNYLDALGEAGVASEFAGDRIALANAEAVCARIASGEPAQGYRRDSIGVEYYCAEYSGAFQIIPTPEEQRATYLGALKDEGLAGKFRSDEAAVAHAGRVCSDLRDGGVLQGMPEDLVGVEVYCGEFADGFHVLSTIDVDGTFTLMDTDLSIYYPSIVRTGGGCEGSGGYSDISAGTQVTVRNGSGDLLAQTALGEGDGGSVVCEFPFDVELTEGEDAYVFEVSRRGSISFTFAELRTRGVALSLGD